jgi:hypothetical protein
MLPHHAHSRWGWIGPDDKEISDNPSDFTSLVITMRERRSYFSKQLSTFRNSNGDLLSIVVLG